ncbi:MAG TPA: DUF4350 domain-containing protein [Povalibacter sp.]|uniref:DUF4350 domain-containing protein n=1 Tax=Povalibacter sp. TaxID=1962978 RepID=UPI002CECB258|nr:DUF4350 domain-containing protein [Povalibacter sp.]HMN46417.1 DUF4350 domain-containing protein [Povalibacter sp.]
MKDRLLTLALAIGAFALFYVLFLHRPSQPREQVTRPITTEKGPNGYLALMRWFEAIDVQPVSLRERFQALGELEGVPATGNLLISTAPHRYPMRDSETAPLRNWVSAGNTLLVVAGLSDTPEWSMGEGIDTGFMKHMEAMTGLRFTQAHAQADADDEAAAEEGEETTEPADEVEPATKTPAEKPRPFANPFQKLDEPLEFSMVPNGEHPLLSGVKRVDARSEYATSKWRVSTASMSDLVLELASDPQTGEPVLWLMRYGNGQILVSAYGSVFVNKLLGEQDNARLLANIVRGSLGPQGRVVIDDAHQGLVAFYDPEKFYGDRRLHASLWWLLGLWLVFVLGSQRLRALDSRWQPIDITNFVRASGGFLARVLKPATAAQQLFTNFFNDLRRQTGQPANGAPLWDWMATRASLAASDLQQLRDLHERTQRGRRIDLPKLQNLLVHVRQQLA